MRGIDSYAIVASIISLLVIAWGLKASKQRGPSRGMGGAQAAIMIALIMAAAVLHGIIVSGIAVATGQNVVSWTAACLHGAIILGAIIRVKMT
jgi:hypothetical protein